MIKIWVEDYCHSCDSFEPDVVRQHMYFDNNFITETNTTIRCKNAKRCAALKRYLEKQLKKETDNE